MKKIILIGYISVFLISIFSNVHFAMSMQDDPELISLDLKGMDIRDVLKILAQKSGLNIVADSAVKGTVTLYIKDVSVKDALDIIVSTNNFAYEESGSLIRIMNSRDYEITYGKRFNDRTKTEIVKLNYANAQEIGNALNQIKTNIGKVISEDVSHTIVLIDNPENINKMKELILQMDVPLITEVFPLDYAKAESLKDKISEIVSKGVGSVRFDERTNKLIVKDTQQKVEDIRKVIDAFDEKTMQVLLDANIVQVTLSDKYSYGIDWANVSKLGDIKLTNDTVLNTGLSNTTPSTFTIATTGRTTTAIISLLKTYGQTNVLSRPRITAINNQEAKILVGAKEVYVTSEVTTTTGGTYHTTDHVQFVDVGVRLGVVPTINKQGFITLKIKPEVSSADSTKTVQLKNPDGSTRTIVPFVTTSEAETSVLVKNDTTIIIGGLMKDTMVDSKERVPFLGDMPLIGKLFSAKGKSKEKTELVIFLTPHIIEGDKTTEEAQKYIADWDKKIEEIKVEDPEKQKIESSKVKLEAKKPVKTIKAIDKKGETNLKEKQPEQKPRKIAAKNDEQSKKKQKPKKPEAKNNKQPKKKWTPIFGSDQGEEIENIENVKAEKSVDVNMTPYEEYYLKIGQEINDLAQKDEDVMGINGDVELQFTLDKEGFLIKGPIVLNEPDLRLVRSAVRIVKKASPFISFPKSLNEDQAEFNVVIRYE